MEPQLESQANFARRRSRKIICILIPIICVIVAFGIGVYYFTKNNSSQSDTNTEVYDDLKDSTPQTAKWVQNEEIQLLRKYLRFKTISLETDFGPCIDFLKKQADDMNLNVSVHYPANEQNPVLLITWQGSRSDLPSILLNSHMDVVPVVEEYWNYPPFAAKMDEYGNIYARGAQDMKSIGMLYLAAIRSLKRNGLLQFKRTVHLTYVPDEEVSGKLGMGAFVKGDTFKTMNVGFAMDEGYPSANDQLDVFYAEKIVWSVNITAHGHSGHGSILFADTAGQKLNYVIDRFMEWRDRESYKWNEEKVPYSNVTSINLTILKGGFKSNVVPPTMTAYFDVRLPIDENFDEIERMIKRWARDAGENVKVDIQKSLNPPPTPIDSSNPYWVSFKRATDELKLNVKPRVFQGATDSRFIRNVGIPVLGFSPLMNTAPMLHEHNEYINAETYLNGIKIYEQIIEKIADI